MDAGHGGHAAAETHNDSANPESTGGILEGIVRAGVDVAFEQIKTPMVELPLKTSEEPARVFGVLDEKSGNIHHA